jgi:hypothetical protein
MPRPLADRPPPMYDSDGMLLEGGIRRRLQWYTDRYKAMTPEQRAATDAAAAAQIDRMDPSGRLRHLIEIGPEGYERERLSG